MSGLRPGKRVSREVRDGAGGRLSRVVLAAALLAVAGCSASPGGAGAASGGAGTARAAGPAGVGAVESLLTSGPAGSAGSRGPSALVPTNGLPSATATTDVAGTEPTHFQTPSKNIGCLMSQEYVRCDIQERSWKPPARPASCPADHGDYGQGLVLGTDQPDFVCAGDTALDPRVRALPYGQAIRAGSFVCVSTTSFLACGNTATGHGFALAKGTFPYRY